MIDQGEDVDMIQDVLQFNQSMKQGKPCPPSRTRRGPLHQELRIKEPTWSGLYDDTKRAWARESNGNKEKIIDQFIADSKSSAPVTKNRNLRTVYRMEFDDSDGYESDLLRTLKVHFNSMPTLPCSILLLTMIVIGRLFSKK